MDIEEVKKAIEDGKPVIVDFYAEWCGPCKVLSPMLDEVYEKAKQEIDDLILFKADVEIHQEFAMQYGIRNMPTLLLFKKGVVVNRLVGLKDQNTLLPFVLDTLK